MVARWQDFLFARWGHSDWWRFAKKMAYLLFLSRPIQGLGYWAALASLLAGLVILTAALLRGQQQNPQIGSRMAVAEQQISDLRELQKDSLRQREVILEKIGDVDRRLREIEYLVRALLWVVGTMILPLLIAALRWLAGFYGHLHRERYMPGVKSKEV